MLSSYIRGGVIGRKGHCKMPDPMTEVTPEFKALTDAIIAAGHTCETVLRRLDARIAGTPAGTGRDNLMSFREQLVEKIRGAESHG